MGQRPGVGIDPARIAAQPGWSDGPMGGGMSQPKPGGMGVGDSRFLNPGALPTNQPQTMSGVSAQPYTATARPPGMVQNRQTGEWGKYAPGGSWHGNIGNRFGANPTMGQPQTMGGGYAGQGQPHPLGFTNTNPHMQQPMGGGYDPGGMGNIQPGGMVDNINRFGADRMNGGGKGAGGMEALIGQLFGRRF